MAEENLVDSIGEVLKAVLKKEYGLDISEVQQKISEYEEKQNNRTEKTLSVATSTWQKLTEILISDGVIAEGDATTEAQIAEWLDVQIEDVYEDYSNNGRFDVSPDEDTGIE